jgi:O-antigen/teichoic acid export membrane protein
VASSFMVQALRILTALAMARLVSPESYGLVGIASAISGIVACLGDLGVARSLVQMRDADRQELEDSALAISASMGLIQLGASLAGGFYLARTRHNPNLLAMGAILGATGLIGCIYQYQMACLNRDMKFGLEAWQNTLSSLATAATGLAFAFSGFGIYALILPPLAAQILSSMAIWWHHKLRWPGHCTRKSILRLLNYGWRVTIAQYASNLQSPLVNFFICLTFPRHTSELVVGMLGRATQVRDLIGHNISASFDRVLYPVLRTASEDPERTRSLLLRAISSISLLCVFSWAWMTATAPLLIRVVLGPAWVEQVPALLRAVAPALLFTGPVLMAIVVTHVLGRPLIWLWSTLATTVILAIALLLGRRWGAVGIAASMTAATILGGMALFTWAMGRMQVPILRLAMTLAPVALAGAAGFVLMRIAIDPVSSLTRAWLAFPQHPGFAAVQPAVVLALVSMAGLLAYTMIVLAFSREIPRALIGLIRRG